MSFRLSLYLSDADFRADFQSRGFAHVPNVLPAENAKRIHKSLTESTPWNLVFTDRGKHIDLPGAQLGAMPKARGATGYADITFVDAQATRYMPGHFLAAHDDRHEQNPCGSPEAQRQSHRAFCRRDEAFNFWLVPLWQPE